MSTDRKFAAFISYSHKDEAFARWLHRALETYQPPKGLLAADAARKPASPVFRDAEELVASSDLTSEIRDALDRSGALVVVCSPHAVQSKWVTREIEYFRETGKADRIFPIIADGEPNAAAPELECLPELLRARDDGHEALAADARGAAAQKRTALLKLIAGLLGLSLGELIDREAQHRRKRRMQFAIGAGIIATVLGILTTAWLSEARRSALEARNRMMGEMRQAFEVEDAPRAIAALAHIWPGLSKEAQDKHRAVLSAWLGRYPGFDESVKQIPDKAIFASGRRLFLKDGDKITALPFDDTHLALQMPDGLIAMNGAGRLLRSQTSGAPKDVTPQNASIWNAYRWQGAAQLRSGAIAFSGMLQSASAGGATPALLFFHLGSGAWRLIEQGYLDQPKVHIDPKCNTLSFDGEVSAASPNVFVAGKGKPQVFSLQALAPTAPGADGALIDFDESAETLKSIAQLCGSGAVQSSDPDVRASISMPNPMEDAQSWQPLDAYDWTPSQPALDYLYTLGQFIQRAKFTVPDAHVKAMAGDYKTAAEQRDVIAGEFSGFDFADGPTQTRGAVGVFWAASGAQYGLRFVCASPAPSQTDAPPLCVDIRFHGDYGAVRILGDWVYIQDMAYAGHPMFFLIRRSDLKVLRMDAPEVQGAPGGGAGAVTLSPSGKQLVLAAQDQFWRFAIDKDQIRFAGKFDAAGLSGAAAEDDGVENASIAFVDEDSIVSARRDGLVFATSLSSGQELWRARIRPTAGTRDAPAHLIAARDDRIAIVGADFAALLDARTGLALAPVAGVFHADRGVTPPDIAPEAVDHSCPPSSRRDACMSSLTLATAVLEAEQNNRQRLSASERGFTLYSSDGALTAAPPVAAPLPSPASAPCRTGWRVLDGRIVRFDPLAALQPGKSESIARLAACAP